MLGRDGGRMRGFVPMSALGRASTFAIAFSLGCTTLKPGDVASPGGDDASNAVQNAAAGIEAGPDDRTIEDARSPDEQDAALDSVVDATVEANTPDETGSADAPWSEVGADASEVGADAPEGGDCAPGELACEGGCVSNGAQHCGNCNNACTGATPVCSVSGLNYACTPACSTNAPTLCGTACVDTSSDANNCKTCGNVCTTTIVHAQAACVAGACSFGCNSGYSVCGQACVDEQTDNGHCGACGIACASGKTCQGGACVCPSGMHDCAGVCRSNASVNGCGTACGTTCPDPTNGGAYGSAACDGASCTLSCNSGLSPCGGACVDQMTDRANCGGCGTTCVSCAAGVCVKPVAIAPGFSHTCALLSNGAVECWGDNTRGQLGNGMTTGLASPPVKVSGLSTAIAVTTGAGHSCALLSGGTLQCWGYNFYGELGNGTTTNSSTPVAVSGISGALAVSARGSHTCALLSAGVVQCWGDNRSGELGDGTTTNSLTPVAVSGLSNVTSITAGNAYECALLSDHSVRCWGDNTYGELGIGTIAGPASCAGGSCSTAPLTVSGLTGATAVAAGEGAHSCAVLSGGAVQCWGYNNDGQLGNGSTGGILSTPVAVSRMNGATAITVGGFHSCALLSDGTVQCWGNNSAGELGNGTTANSPLSVPIPGLGGVSALVAGNHHTCALQSAGTLLCWGDNTYGELGNGTSNLARPAVVIW
jgi:alpha-tubulin suppressor-like RCC1 family protein